jgi:hypothetical protein
LVGAVDLGGVLISLAVTSFAVGTSIVYYLQLRDSSDEGVRRVALPVMVLSLSGALVAAAYVLVAVLRG